MQKRKLSLWLRAAGGIFLLAVLIGWIGIGPLKESLTHFHPAYYGIALLLLFVHFYFQGVIIHSLLASKGTFVRALHIFRLTIICNFFGLFLPGGIGPDLVLCYNMVRSTEKKERALSAIIFTRIAVLFLMALIAFGSSFHPLAARTEIRIITGAVLLAFLIYYFLMANRNSLALARKVLAWLNRHKITAVLYKTYFALADYGCDRKTLIRIIPFLVGSAFIKILTEYFVSQALGFGIPLRYFFMFVPLITVISAVPITFASLGVREGSYVGLFALAGVPAEQAIAISLVSFTLAVLIAVVGAVLYVFHGASLVTKEEQAAGLDA